MERDKPKRQVVALEVLVGDLRAFEPSVGGREHAQPVSGRAQRAVAKLRPLRSRRHSAAGVSL